MSNVLKTNEYVQDGYFHVPPGVQIVHVGVVCPPSTTGWARVTWWEITEESTKLPEDVPLQDQAQVADMFRRAARLAFPEQADRMIAVMNKMWKED